MTAIPCVASVPATACASVSSTYTAISTTDKEGKKEVTVTISGPTFKDDKMRDIFMGKGLTG